MLAHGFGGFSPSDGRGQDSSFLCPSQFRADLQLQMLHSSRLFCPYLILPGITLTDIPRGVRHSSPGHFLIQSR